MHVLIVQQHHTLLQRLCRLDSALSISHTRTGPAAWCVVRKDRPDVILLDLLVPGGIKLLFDLKESLSAVRRSIPLVIISSHLSRTQQEIVEELQADACIDEKKCTKKWLEGFLKQYS